MEEIYDLMKEANHLFWDTYQSQPEGKRDMEKLRHLDSVFSAVWNHLSDNERIEFRRRMSQ